MALLDEAGSIFTRDGKQVSYGTGPEDLLQLDASGAIPASVLTLSGGDIASVTAGTGLTGGGNSGAVTLNVDVGVTQNKIPRMDAVGYPAANGSQITNVAAATAATASGFSKTSPFGATMAVVENEEEIVLTGLTNDSVANLLPAKGLLLGIGTRVTEEIQGKKAQGTITLTGISVEDQTFEVNGVTYTWKATRAGAGQVTIGADAAESCTNIITAITADDAFVTATQGTGTTVIITAVTPGTAGNAYTLSAGTSANLTVDGAGTLGTTTAGTDITGWSVGDSATAARFTPSIVVLTAGATYTGGVHLEGGISTDATGPWQETAAKARVTLDAIPGQGKVRVTVYALTFTSATS